MCAAPSTVAHGTGTTESVLERHLSDVRIQDRYRSSAYRYTERHCSTITDKHSVWLL